MDPQKQQDPLPPPQSPGSYSSPQPNYDPNYLDSIAAKPRQAQFLSGKFGKVLIGLIILLIIGVGLLLSSPSGKSSTADLEKLSVRLENLDKTAKSEKKYMKSRNLKAINQDFLGWIGGNTQQIEEFLKSAKIKKNNYSKKMVSDEKIYIDDLNKKYQEARFADNLDSVYATSMTAETGKIIGILNNTAKKNSSKKIREFAQNAAENLSKIQKKFDSYIDDGN